MTTLINSTIVTRFAPSPSGYLHLGNVRTALFNYLAACKEDGCFILRIEDTDAARSDEAYLHSLIDDLHWLGIKWDVGPDVSGAEADYKQSKRMAIYDEWLAKLNAKGLIYPCYCSQVELSISRRNQIAAGTAPRYAGTCRHLTAEQRAEREERGLQPALRFKVLSGEQIQFVDVVHGEQSFLSDDIGDFIVRRADGSSAFFFSNAIDDALMGVTLVLRGDDHLANTPRQLMLLRACGLNPPERYGHMPMILGMDGAPLSKRHGSTSLHELRERGFLPAAICNLLIRLGHFVPGDQWVGPDQRMLEQDDLQHSFELHRLADALDLERFGRAPARFDETQLLHWQKEAVARLSHIKFQEWLKPELPMELPAEQVAAFCQSVKHNVTFPPDVRPWVKVVFGELDDISDDACAAIRDAGAVFFNAAIELLPRAGMDFKALTKELSTATARKGPALFMPLRAALTGHTHGPELGPLLPLLGMERIRARFVAASTMN